jgi:sugar/nucleoside kinase (ribokinase family)
LKASTPRIGVRPEKGSGEGGRVIIVRRGAKGEFISEERLKIRIAMAEANSLETVGTLFGCGDSFV